MIKKIRFYKWLLSEICETLCTICLDRSMSRDGGRYREIYRDHYEVLKHYSNVLRGREEFNEPRCNGKDKTKA